MPSIKREDIKDAVNYINNQDMLNKLNKIYSTIPSGDCSGCGNCCMESVGVSYIEFLNIYNYINKNKDIKIKVMNKILDYYFLEYIKKQPCPFKDENNRCLIYDVRPLNCRIYGHWKKEDYEKNYDKVKNDNINLSNVLSENYGIKINEKISNYKINYCYEFKPRNGYMTKEERLSFSDEVMILDSILYSKGLIKFDFKDRGIVDYFIESIFYENLAMNIKIKITKDENIRETALKRIKKLLLEGGGKTCN
ncbi:YkgJ family cysteine cluster protein [Alkalithermobacter paradoxus]|uniref:Flagellin N-methylase n=1 Tax=Alkalithermobacter paradoxus TaxID=29349 RepID=A0A1V4I7G9_9FIRM|nr:flagellin N-methylase [[Clostridium] thermoalcaliphilum]